MTMTIVALQPEKLALVREDPGLALDLVLPEEDEGEQIGHPIVDLDKTWHGIHYLLTGTAWEGDPPLNALVAGGEELPDPDEEWGYGPPRLLSPADTSAFAHALALLTNSELTSRFYPPDMLSKGIYPEIWDRDPSEDDTLLYLLEGSAALRQFVEHAREHGRGLLIALV
jgi:hypothetical protein